MSEEDPVALLRRESRSLVQRLRVWTAARWAAAAPPFGTRGDLLHHLAQDLAALAAEAEGLPCRPLPRLDSDLGLPDQLAVCSDDLVRADPDPRVARFATAHLLAHRRDLLDEQVPTALAEALGLADPEQAGRAACEEVSGSPLEGQEGRPAGPAPTPRGAP